MMKKQKKSGNFLREKKKSSTFALAIRKSVAK